MNRKLLFAGAAALALAGIGAAAVSADTPSAPREERHRPFADIDANRDGFVSRDEARAQAERMFDRMDSNDDGKLDSSDRGRTERRVVEKHVIRKGDGKDARTFEERIEEDVVIEHVGPGDGERRVIVRKHGDRPRHGGRGGHRMHGGMPMPFMMLMHSDEADTNGDGVLSKPEMVAQHLRFFDAGDANGDGKIKFEPPPMPPAPPSAPTPPEPPAPPAPPKR